MLTHSAAPRHHLLLPSHPTPNGRLHLGHIAGPYLKMDVLKRALQRRGDHAVLMFALDSYESYVLLRAHQLGIDPAAVVERYAREIEEDLTALDIDVDFFLDPLKGFGTLYQRSVLDSIETLRRRSAVEERTESFLYCADSSRYITGCWLLGFCPNCRLESGGYSCEACGCHYRPEELNSKRSRLEEGALESVTRKTLFMRVPNEGLFRQHMEELLPPAFTGIVSRYLDRPPGCTLRISVPGTWGVPVTVDDEAQSQIVYSGFASLGLLVACGQEYALRFGTTNPLHRESDVNVVCSFGIDNTVSRTLSCVSGALAAEDLRPPDSLLLNYFYRLEGAKFSTSRNHAIWASAIAGISPTISDIVRFYLAVTAPEQGETDFCIADFLTAATELVEQWNPVIAASLAQAKASPAPDGMMEAFAKTLSLQEKCLDTRAFRLGELPGALRSWIAAAPEWTPNASYWWLKAFTVLAWPLLPKLSSALWSHFGHDGLPALESFLHLKEQRGHPVQLFEPVRESELRNCTSALSKA